MEHTNCFLLPTKNPVCHYIYGQKRGYFISALTKNQVLLAVTVLDTLF